MIKKLGKYIGKIGHRLRSCQGWFVAIFASVLLALLPTCAKAMKGLTHENGHYRYYKGGERIREKWKRVNGKKYYFKKNGNAATGSYKVKGQYYVFDEKGRLLEPSKIKLRKIGQDRFCVDPKGRAQSGWLVINGKLYYAAKNGKCKTNVTYQGITLTKEGHAKEDTNSLLKIKAMQIVRQVTTPQMTAEEKLRACFRYISGSTFHYLYKKWPNVQESGWQVKYALNMLKTHEGVCFHYASAFAALASELGYQPILVIADTPRRHCWVKIDGISYDPRRGKYAKSNYLPTAKVLAVMSF